VRDNSIGEFEGRRFLKTIFRNPLSPQDIDRIEHYRPKLFSDRTELTLDEIREMIATE
jgi:hypothetical protein